MRLGILEAFNEDTLKIANEGPFECLELRGVEPWIDDAEARKAALSQLYDYNLEVASFMELGPSLRTPKEEMPAVLDKYGKLMDLANEFGGAVLTGAAPMGYDPSKGLDANVALYKEVYSPLGDLAEKKGAKIAFENWPGGKGPFGENGCLCVTAESIEMMLEAVPTQAIGLEFDPSHFMWQGIDAMRAAVAFMDRIHIIHAKDTEIDEERLEWCGAWGNRWWRYRLPGFASFDWQAFLALFPENGVDCDVIIEHEDSSFDGDRRALGFLLSGKYLQSVMLA